jgi:hypothetical protein
MIFSPTSPNSRACIKSGVSIGPGAIEFAVIPNRAPSRAITFMNAITPPFAAE